MAVVEGCRTGGKGGRVVIRMRYGCCVGLNFGVWRWW